MTTIHRCQGYTDHGEQCPATTTDPARIGTWRCSKHTATVVHRCALCSADLGGLAIETVDQIMAAHHAVCPKRPIEVGDAVLWEFPSRETWAEGRITALDLKDGKIAHATILVAKHSGGWGSGIKRLPKVGEEHKFGCLPEDEITIRRILRSTEVQAIGVDDYVEWRPDGSPLRAAGQVLAKSQTTAVVRIREVSKTWTAFEACPIVGDTRSVPLSDLRRVPYPEANVQRVDSGARAAMKAASRIAAVVDAARQGHIKVEAQAPVFPAGAEDPPDEMKVVNPDAFGTAARLGLKHGPNGSGRRGPCDPDCRKCAAERASAPALVDGIDREVCLARWFENRMAVEGGVAPPNVLTRMQVDVARALWMQRFGAKRSAELRELVAADREAERCRVRVDLEVQPWE